MLRPKLHPCLALCIFQSDAPMHGCIAEYQIRCPTHSTEHIYCSSHAPLGYVHPNDKQKPSVVFSLELRNPTQA